MAILRLHPNSPTADIPSRHFSEYRQPAVLPLLAPNTTGCTSTTCRIEVVPQRGRGFIEQTNRANSFRTAERNFIPTHHPLPPLPQPWFSHSFWYSLTANLHVITSTSLCYISLFLGCWNIDDTDSLVEQLTMSSCPHVMWRHSETKQFPPTNYFSSATFPTSTFSSSSGGHQDPNVCLSRFISSCALMPRWWLNSIKPLSLCKTPREIRTQAIKHVIWKLLLIYFWWHLWEFSKMVNMSFSITIQQQQQYFFLQFSLLFSM